MNICLLPVFCPSDIKFHCSQYKSLFQDKIRAAIKSRYCIQPNYRPCPHNRPPLTIYFNFTYYRPFDDLLALVVENKFT